MMEPIRLRLRIEALDQLERCLTPLPAQASAFGGTGSTLYERARATQARLEGANEEAYAAIRRDIRRGQGGNSLLHWLPDLGKMDGSSRLDREGYDFLDAVIAGVLHFEEPDAAVIQPTAEMVPYQPTPARHIFDLLERSCLTGQDVLVDIGSGLGHVPILTAIWTGARGVGVELEPAYVECARRTAESLNLGRVTFVQQEARAADFSSGTVFYLYTPFIGSMLRETLDLLRGEASTRAIRVCTFGPCAHAIAAEDWLDAVGEARPNRISIFRSRP